MGIVVRTGSRTSTGRIPRCLAMGSRIYDAVGPIVVTTLILGMGGPGWLLLGLLNPGPRCRADTCRTLGRAPRRTALTRGCGPRRQRDACRFVSVGDGQVLVHGRGVADQGEHPGGQVGAGDGESVWQVAVDGGAVGSAGGFAGKRGRADDRPVQVAATDLFLAVAHVGADVAEECSACQRL